MYITCRNLGDRNFTFLTLKKIVQSRALPINHKNVLNTCIYPTFFPAPNSTKNQLKFVFYAP